MNENLTTLLIDLTLEKHEKKKIKLDSFKAFLGGSGIGWMLAAEYIKHKAHPFSPENPIIISAGVLVGTLCPSASKISAITKFPTLASVDGKNFIEECTSGTRYFGLMLKMAGYGHLIITGKAKRPVYLNVYNENVEFKDATNLWSTGYSTDHVANILLEKEGKDSGIIVIGRAGEKKVFHALAFVDKMSSLGRGGLGAVMGSKNLKAIVVRGTNSLNVAKPREFMEEVRKIRSRIVKWPNYKEWITRGMGGSGWEIFRNTQYPGKWEKTKWDKLYGEKIKESFDRVQACISCILSCKNTWMIRNGEFAGDKGFSPATAKIATSGQLLDVEDYRKMLHFYKVANDEGIDFYTITRLIDFVTTLYQQEKLTDKDTQGVKLTRDYGCYLNLLYMTVNREKFGDILADGWFRLYKEFGIDPQEYWYGGICKGVDFIYDARPSHFHPLMMTFFTRPRPHHGGSHTLTNIPGRSMEEIRKQVERWGLSEDAIKRVFTPTSYSGKFNVGIYTKYMEDMMRVKNALGICSIHTFMGLIFGDDMTKLYSAATGLEVSSSDVIKCGERIFNLSKLLNVREGFYREDDKPPEIWFKPMTSPEGEIVLKDYFDTKALSREDIEKILDDYYRERGWNIERGIPTKEKLTELGIIEWVNVNNFLPNN
jgi:aldehyde:ferredoxin oxidoreductase